MDKRTVEILKRFSESWDETEIFVQELIETNPEFEGFKQFKQFINGQRNAGEDKYFRLGTSVCRLLFSRSVVHGLRRDQKSILIEAIGRDGFEVSLRDGDKIYREYRIKSLNDEKLLALFETLRHTLVD